MIVPIRSPQDCPSEVALANMAAGRVEPTERDSILEHVSTCERCGMALGEALSEPKENDLAALSIVKGLQTSKPAFQKQFAKRLAAGKPAAPWFKHLAIAATLAFACFGAWKWFRPTQLDVYLCCTAYVQLDVYLCCTIDVQLDVYLCCTTNVQLDVYLCCTTDV